MSYHDLFRGSWCRSFYGSTDSYPFDGSFSNGNFRYKDFIFQNIVGHCVAWANITLLQPKTWQRITSFYRELNNGGLCYGLILLPQLEQNPIWRPGYDSSSPKEVLRSLFILELEIIVQQEVSKSLLQIMWSVPSPRTILPWAIMKFRIRRRWFLLTTPSLESPNKSANNSHPYILLPLQSCDALLEWTETDTGQTSLGGRIHADFVR